MLEDTISRNASVQAILSSSKPSFLVWDKVYQKLTDVEEETWLLRAAESAATFFNGEVTKVEDLRFVFQSLETSASDVVPWRLWMPLFQNAARFGIPLLGNREPPTSSSETGRHLCGTLNGASTHDRE